MPRNIPILLKTAGITTFAALTMAEFLAVSERVKQEEYFPELWKLKDHIRSNVVSYAIKELGPVQGWGDDSGRSDYSSEPAGTVHLPLITFEYDKQSHAFSERRPRVLTEPTTYEIEDEKARYATCSVVLVAETGRDWVGVYHYPPETNTDREGWADSVEFAVCVISWPEKQVLALRTFKGLPPDVVFKSERELAEKHLDEDGSSAAWTEIEEWLDDLASKSPQ